MNFFGMYHFRKYRKWYIEWSFISKYEGALLHIDLVLPTPKTKVLSFGICIFTCTIFFFELARVD